MYVRRILRSERVSQEISLIARGESKLISAANNAHPQTVNAWITSMNNSNAKLLEIEDHTTTRLQKKSQIFCDVILSNMLLGANDPQKFHFWVPHPK